MANAAATTVQEKRRITAEDLYNFEIVLDPQISPNGEQIIFVVQRVDRKKEKKYSSLWLVPTTGGEARQFTFGDHNDSQPRWSPDGRQIAFLSNRDEEKQPQIYLIPVDGGEAHALTEMKGDFGSFYWSPEGKSLLVQFRKKDQEALEREENEQKKELGIVARHITRAHFRMDGAGYLPQERWHLWTVTVSDGEAQQLTDGAYDEEEPCWSPDGTEILFISNRSEDPDLESWKQEIFVMPTAGGEARTLDAPVGNKWAPAFSPDGKWISYVGTEGKGNWWQNNGLWLVPADGSGQAQNLTASYDVDVSSSTLGDVVNRNFTRPVWGADSKQVYFEVSRHGDTGIYAMTLGGEMQKLLAPDGIVSNFSLDDAQEKMAYVWSNFKEPGQVWLYRMAAQEAVPLTHFNEEWLSKIDLGELETVWYEGPDGNQLQGWILKPPGFDPTRRYPSILEIHGGPWAQYGNLFMHEFFYLAAHDYVVYFSNPRGGQGYGEAHSKAIHLNWGGPDYDDVMAWADYMEGQPYIDPEQMGVTGGSYGGYMTLWIIGHTDRFEAAVAQRVVSNLISFWGSSDVGYLFDDPWTGGKAPWEDFAAYWQQSPMKYIANASTPTLIIHSEQDMRCNLEQGTQAFLALKQLGVDTELVIFPNESHGLSRIGRTDRRIVRLNHILRWFEKYLKA